MLAEVPNKHLPSAQLWSMSNSNGRSMTPNGQETTWQSKKKKNYFNKSIVPYNFSNMLLILWFKVVINKSCRSHFYILLGHAPVVLATNQPGDSQLGDKMLDDWATRFGQLHGRHELMLTFLHFSCVFEMYFNGLNWRCVLFRFVLILCLEQINIIVLYKVTTIKHLHIKSNFMTVYTFYEIHSNCSLTPISFTVSESSILKVS